MLKCKLNSLSTDIILILIAKLPLKCAVNLQVAVDLSRKKYASTLSLLSENMNYWYTIYKKIPECSIFKEEMCNNDESNIVLLTKFVKNSYYNYVNKPYVILCNLDDFNKMFNDPYSYNRIVGINKYHYSNLYGGGQTTIMIDFIVGGYKSIISNNIKDFQCLEFKYDRLHNVTNTPDNQLILSYTVDNPASAIDYFNNKCSENCIRIKNFKLDTISALKRYMTVEKYQLNIIFNSYVTLIYALECTNCILKSPLYDGGAIMYAKNSRKIKERNIEVQAGKRVERLVVKCGSKIEMFIIKNNGLGHTEEIRVSLTK